MPVFCGNRHFSMSLRASRTGNETRCQTPTVFCQAAYKQRMAERLHPNAITELDISRECWESSIAGQHFSGYIQQFGILPFHVMFYTEQLNIARECWESSIAGQHFSGYIQQLGILPFHVVFYPEQQLQLYVRACQTTNTVVHLDQTGWE